METIKTKTMKTVTFTKAKAEKHIESLTDIICILLKLITHPDIIKDKSKKSIDQLYTLKERFDLAKKQKVKIQ